jgi:hypothetical protein
VVSNHIVTCPHCMNQVPWGAHVCRGCQAEIQYGTPRAVTAFFGILCLILGWYAAKVVRLYITDHSIVLWTVFGIVFAASVSACTRFCRRRYAGNTVFRRFYRR